MNLLFRTDASVAIGTGHVMRCLALAQAWQDERGGNTIFAMAGSTPAINARLRNEGCEVVSLDNPAGSSADCQATAHLASERQSKWIVVDGYHFDGQYQQALQSTGCRIVWVDDYGHARCYSADFVLNSNIGVSAELYSNRSAKTRLLLGPRFAALRREFSSWTGWQRTIPSHCRNVLVTMGGSDPENLTGKVVEALRIARIDGVSATILVGGSNPRTAEIERAAHHSGLEIDIQTDVTDVAPLMAQADVAISAAGSTCFELCLLGLPALLVDVAENQTAVAQELHRRGCCIHVGGRTTTSEQLAEALRKLVESEHRRCELSEHCRKLVDGKGAARVVSAIRDAERLGLRRAVPDDCRLLWEWANDPEVRSASFSSSPIRWDTHSDWFAKKVAADNTVILIAQNSRQVPVGQVRFELQGNEAEINVSVSRESRGHGWAACMIENAVRDLIATHECAVIHAFIKPTNTASIKAFERAGFVNIGNQHVRGCDAVHFVCTRE